MKVKPNYKTSYKAIIEFLENSSKRCESQMSIPPDTTDQRVDAMKIKIVYETIQNILFVMKEEISRQK